MEYFGNAVLIQESWEYLGLTFSNKTFTLMRNNEVNLTISWQVYFGDNKNKDMETNLCQLNISMFRGISKSLGMFISYKF